MTLFASPIVSAPTFGIILQARMGSTRLPGKVLLPFFGETSILELLVQRLQQLPSGLPVVLATSVHPADDVLAACAATYNIPCYRGDEQDVLQRFIGCATAFGFTSIIRVCADNPFMDAELLEQLIAEAPATTADYCSFQLAGQLPAIRSHWGIFAEYTTREALERAAATTADPFYHEHVTNFLYGHPDQFQVSWLRAPEGVFEADEVRLTIDTPEDFAGVQQLYTDLVGSGKAITFKNILQALALRPELRTHMRAQIARFQK